MKVAVAQFTPQHREIDQNLRKIEELVRTADAELIVFPELALTGYLFTKRSDLAALAQPIDGPLAQELSRIAVENGKALLTGFLEAHNGKFYNSAVGFDSKGKQFAHYRKVHLFNLEKKVFTHGDLSFPVFPLECLDGNVITVGVMVCYDWRFPESARSLALAGAEIIAVPSNIVTTTGMLLPVLQVRAFENKAIVLFADRTGTESTSILGQDITLTFRGDSAIVNYNGSILAKATLTQETILTAEVDPTATRNKSFSPLDDIFGDRRPDTYRI